MKPRLSPVRMYFLAVLINLIPLVFFRFIVNPTGDAKLIIALTLIVAAMWLIAYLPYLILGKIDNKYLLGFNFFLPSILIFGIAKVWAVLTASQFDEMLHLLWILIIPNLVMQVIFAVKFSRYKPS